MNYFKFGFILALMFTDLAAHGQKKQGRALADSMVAVITADDTAAVKLLKKAADIYSKINIDTGIKLAERCLAIATKTKWDKGIGLANMALAVNYDERADYPAAMAHYMDALKINEQIGYKRGIALSNWGIANVYRSQHRLTTATEYDLKALHYFSAVNDEITVAQLLLNIGNNFYLLDKDDSALDYFSRALASSRKLGDEDGIILCLQNIGCLNMKNGRYNKALSLFFTCVDEMRASGENIRVGSVYGNIGGCYVSVAEDTTGIKPDRYVPASKAANLHLAVLYLDSALQYSRSVGNLDDQRITLGDMAEAYEAAGDYKNALECRKQYGVLKDSLFSIEDNARIGKLETQRAMDLKQKDVEIARLRSRFYILCITLLVMVLIAGIFIVRKQLRSNKKLSVEKIRHVRRLKSQSKILEHIAHIQSHELRGAVSTMLGLTQLFNLSDPADPGNIEVIDGINEVALKMDTIVTAVIVEENKLIRENAEYNR